MNPDSQILIPDSFIALFRDERNRLTVTREHVASRYELCEDLATLLTEHCRDVHWRDGVEEAEVLRRCLQGLLADAATVEAHEARWVVCRTAELLQWPWQTAAPDSIKS